MALSGTARLALSLYANQVNALDLNTAQSELSYTKILEFTTGTGANQATTVFSDQRTLTASSTETLDLSGSLTDAFGNVIAFTKIKAIIIYAAIANTNDVVVGGAAGTQFVAPFGSATDKVNVKPGGFFAISAPDASGLAVVNASTDSLKIANSSSGTSVTYDIVIIGV